MVADAVFEGGEAVARVGVGEGSVDGGGLAEEHDALACSGDGGVEQVALEELAGGSGHGDDDVGYSLP